MRRFILAIGLLLVPANAFAQDAREAPVTPESTPPPAETNPLPMERLRVSGGFKIGYVGSRGFDTYADTDTLPQFSIDATYMLWSSGRLGLAAGLGWDAGGRDEKLRGLDTNFAMHRFLVPLEARLGLKEWVWAFGKVAPGAALALGKIEDPSSPAALSSSGWAFATDLSAGATFAVGARKGDRRSVRFIMTPEVGYSITTAAPMNANPGRDADDLLGTDADTNLRSVALSGFFWRATVGLAW
jgi:hypothetical protein